MKIEPPSTGILAARTRFLLLFLVVMCLSINWANILTFNFTVICMHPRLLPEFTENDTLGHEDKSRFFEEDSYLNKEMSSYEKSQAMGVVAAGALVANLPIVILINRYGPRYLFTVVGLLGAAATALVPFSLKIGFGWFLAVRVLQGIAFAGDMATFGHFVTYWTYHKQYAFFTASLCTYVQIAPIFTNPISGMLCESSWRWPAVYYVHAAVAAALFTAFFLFYRNDPNNHPLVNDLEKSKIARGRDSQDMQAQKYIPYKDILKSLAAWAVFVGACGNFIGINLVYQFSPTYLNKVQHFEVVKTGFMAALPPLLMGIMKEIAGLINDRIPKRLMGETVKTRVFNSIAFLSISAFLVALSFIPSGNGNLALFLLTSGSCLMGFNIGGFYKSGSIIAGPYAPLVLGQVSTAMTATMLLVPVIVNPLTTTNTRAEWALAFYVMAGLIVACNTFYVVFAKGEPEWWARSDYFRERMERRRVAKALKSSNGAVYAIDQQTNGAAELAPKSTNVQNPVLAA